MARLFLAVLALLLAAASPVPTLAADAEERWIAFTPTAAGQIGFTAVVDGREIAAILDTGASHTVLARSSAAVDVARVTAGGAAVAVGGDVAFGRMPVGRIEVGALVRTGGEVLVADLPADAAGGAAVELLVGQDLIGAQAIDIDYRAHRFRLLRSGRMPFAGEIAPLTAMPGRGLPLTELRIAGRRFAPVLVDTGDGAAATLGPDGRAALPRPVAGGVAWGLAGAVPTETSLAPAISLGSATVGDVEVRVEGAGGFAARLGLAGRIGAGVLSRYRVLIDPGAGRMVLAVP